MTAVAVPFLQKVPAKEYWYWANENHHFKISGIVPVVSTFQLDR